MLPPAIVTWETPSAINWCWLILSGALGAIGQAFLARAYDAGDVSIVAPFDFMRLPIAALFGYLVFSELPDTWSIVGTLTIIASALYLLRCSREEKALTSK